MTIPRGLADGLSVTGVWAVLGGRRFKSTRVKPDGTVRLGYTGVGEPGHRAFTFDEAAGAWTAVVPATACDQIVEIAHRATYRGHLCDVLEINGRQAVLSLVRADDRTAADLGFETVERGVHQRAVDLTGLDGYFEVHKDVFFPYWQQMTFGFSPNAGTWERYVPDPVLPEIGYDRFRLGRFAVVNGIERPAEGVPADVGALFDVSVLANYHGEEYEVSTIWPGGMATLRGRAGTERQAHVATLYNYQEIQHDLLFDRWRAERATGRP